MKRLHLIITGKVQGIFFRANTQKKAIELGLTGWVKNINDDVEVVAEGAQKTIEGLIARLGEGPPLSHVEDVEVDWEDYKGEFDDFDITWAY